MPDPLIIAVPKGRLLDEALPILAAAGLTPEAAFADPDSRALRFRTADRAVDLIRVRSFDAATFAAHGAAQLALVGSDVLEEFRYAELYAPIDLGVGRCRVSVAGAPGTALDGDRLRVATKYPRLSARHFAGRGIRAECVKLNGAIELAPLLGLTQVIVDLVSTGRTLRDNGLVELERVADVSARLVVNRVAFKTGGARVSALVERFRSAAHPAHAAA